MNLKHYLRGLGIGILVTAIFLGLTGREEAMTDAEIKIRAAQLGMVEETVLADLDSDETPVETQEEEVLPSQTEMVNESSSEDNEEAAWESVEEGAGEGDTAPDSSVEDESTAKPETETDDQGTEYYIVITIENGNSSSVVSRKLYEAGLVTSAQDYDSYLTTNGYDRRLSAGEHKIPLNASEEQIARILCGME